MNIKSIEISRSLLEFLRNLPEDQVQSFVDSLRLDVSEIADGMSARLAMHDGRVGTLVIDTEDGSTALVTLEVEPD